MICNLSPIAILRPFFSSMISWLFRSSARAIASLSPLSSRSFRLSRYSFSFGFYTDIKSGK